MLFTAGAALVALVCIVASGRRLAWAVAPIALEPRAIAKELGGEHGGAFLAALKAELASEARSAWLRDLTAAFDEAPGPRRDALVNEQLFEFESRAGRWARVPRVCASIGTSSGLLFGSLALLQGLAVSDGQDGGAGGPDVLHDALFSALGSLSLGIAGTAFCVAVHVRANRLVRERRAAIDELVERLERVAPAAPDAREGPGAPETGGDVG
jgi:hypothetical protein